MKTFKKIQSLFLLSMALMLIITSCSKKSGPSATINVLAQSANKSGDVKGNGGSVTKTWTFTNPGTTAGWDMSIDGKSGSFQLVLKDASGTVMLNKTLTAIVGPRQSADGTTAAGTAGEWSATATLTNFDGTGDYSFR